MIGQLIRETSAKQDREYSLREYCDLFEVSRSGYYDHQGKNEKPRRRDDALLGVEIEGVFRECKGRYGSVRIVSALREKGHRCGKTRVRRLMVERDLQAKSKRRHRPQTTQSNHTFPIAPNLLQQAPRAQRVDQHWQSDITYLMTGEGWLYLAGTLDSYSRRVVGWKTSESLAKQIVIDSARSAFRNRQPKAGLIYHSDRGCQYASHDCREMLKANGAVQSMSRKGRVPFGRVTTMR